MRLGLGAQDVVVRGEGGGGEEEGEPGGRVSHEWPLEALPACNG
ncbi:MAG: hypothetical protein ABIO70_29605 [Pseudomonadota bacterium]